MPAPGSSGDSASRGPTRRRGPTWTRSASRCRGDVAFVVVSPPVEFVTKESRGALPSSLPFFDAVRSINSAAYLVAAFASGDYARLRHVRGRLRPRALPDAADSRRDRGDTRRDRRGRVDGLAQRKRLERPLRLRARPVQARLRGDDGGLRTRAHGERGKRSSPRTTRAWNLSPERPPMGEGQGRRRPARPEAPRRRAPSRRRASAYEASASSAGRAHARSAPGCCPRS